MDFLVVLFVISADDYRADFSKAGPINKYVQVETLGQNIGNT